MGRSDYHFPWIVALLALTGCAAPKPALVAAAEPVAVADDAEPVSQTTTLAAAVPAEEPAAPEPIPSECGDEATFGKDKLCVPAASYARKLCGGIYPEVALGMFAKGTPFTRVYLAGDVDAWNASGGLTHRARLAFDEEVIVLAKHAPGGSGGIVMTGMQASFDVLRWDGTCVSVMEGELTTKKPPAPKPAPVPFSRLEETTRRALLASPKVKSTYDELGKQCATTEKAKCTKAEQAFAKAVVEHVRSGGSLPTPARRP